MVTSERQQVDRMRKNANRLVRQYQENLPELRNIYNLMLWNPMFIPEAEQYFQQILDVIGIEVYGEDLSHVES